MKNLICIECPKGCRIRVDDNLCVTGNRCNRGKVYAINEVTNPKRILTTTIKINSKFINRLPVITSEALNKDLLFEVMNILQKLEVNPPIKVKDCILKNILNTGCDILASRTILE